MGAIVAGSGKRVCYDCSVRGLLIAVNQAHRMMIYHRIFAVSNIVYCSEHLHIYLVPKTGSFQKEIGCS